MLGKRTRLLLIGATLSALMLFSFVVTQPILTVSAIFGIDDLALVVGIMLIAGGSFGLGMWFQEQFTKQALIESVGADYVNDTATLFNNTVACLTQEQINEKNLVPSAIYYFARKAEYGAQYFVNETTFPTDKVLALTGLEPEMQALLNGTKNQLENLNEIPEGHAETTFTGDLGAWTVNAMTQKDAYGTAGLIQKYQSLKTNDLVPAYGLVETWLSATSPSGLEWSVGTSQSLHEGYLFLDTGGTQAYFNSTSSSFKVANGTTLHYSTWYACSTSNTGYLDLCNATDGTVLKSLDIATASTTTYGEESWTFESETDETADVYFRTSMYRGTNFWSAMGTITCWIDGTPHRLDPFYPILKTTGTNDNALVSYGYANSTVTMQYVDFKELQRQVALFSGTVKQQINTAITMGQAYWQYLRLLGYTDYSQLPTLIPPLDSVLPPSNSTFWQGAEIGTVEWYAMMSAYMASLNELFKDPNIRRNIESVDFSDINFTSLPAWCEGTVFDNSSDTWTNYCSSIWIQPLVGSITIIAGQNNTLGTSAQIIYQEDATKKITYLLATQYDIVNASTCTTRNKYGVESNVSSYTVAIDSLEKYAVTYITDYEGLYIETETTWNMPALMSAFMMIVIIMALAGSLTRKRRR